MKVLKFYKFGSYLYGESNDKDIVIISDIVPKHTEKYDLHILHPTLLEPIYPESATKSPNLVKMCMKYCSELPKETKNKISIDYEKLHQEIKNIHIKSFESYLNILFSDDNIDNIKHILSKQLFKLIQTKLIHDKIKYITNNNEQEKLFYKSGLVELHKKYIGGNLTYEPKNKILQIKSNDMYALPEEIWSDHLFFLEDIIIREFFENITIKLNTIKVNEIYEYIAKDEEEPEEDEFYRCTIEQYLKDVFKLPESFKIENDETITVYEYYYEGTIWYP